MADQTSIDNTLAHANVNAITAALTHARVETTYLGEPASFWTDIAVVWLPFIIVALLIVTLGGKRRKRHLAMYELSVERQAKALEAMHKTNQLLAEISGKLDKGAPAHV